MVKPLIPYVGSKAKLLSHIVALLPPARKRYFEPFLGGGSVLLHLLLQNPQFARYHANDADTRVMGLYEAVRDDADGFVARVDALQRDVSRESFARMLAEYNALTEPDHATAARAALFYCLTKLAFNYNLKYDRAGVAHATYSPKNARWRLAHREHLLRVGEALRRRVGLHNCDYREFLRRARPRAGDFVFFDPPYRVQRGLGCANRYYGGARFEDADYRALAGVCARLTAAGVLWMVTLDADPRNVELFTSRAFGPCRVRRFARPSFMSNKKDAVAEELIAVNYDV
jgi:DNA adenine methylase